MKKLMFMLTAAACTAGICATTPQGVSFAYQGCVVDDKTGKPRTDPFVATISLYPDAKAGEAQWSRAFPVTPATNGVFNVAVTDAGNGTTSLSDVLSSGNEVYVGLAVEGYAEIPIRQRLLPVPNAIYAQNASRAKGDFTVVGNLTVNGTVQFGRCQVDLTGTFSAPKLSTRSVIADKATVSGPATVDGEMTVNARATFKDNVEISGTEVTATNAQLSVKSLLVGGAEVSLPVGTIVMWYGKPGDRPKGWEICDGRDGRPNLCGRFPLGAEGLNDWGQTGGAKSVKLTKEQLAPHAHEYFGDDQLSAVVTQVSKKTGYDADSTTDGSYGSGFYNTSVTPVADKQQPVSIMPPYCSVYFIMKVK